MDARVASRGEKKFGMKRLARPNGKAIGSE